MGWWQWDRFESSSGTGQNLGYALQWPLFAAACVWGYRRFIQLEAEAAEEEAVLAAEQSDVEGGAPHPDGDAPDATPQQMPTPRAEFGARRRRSGPLTEIPADFLPGRPSPSAPEPAAAGRADPTRDDYNRMLADLAASDSHQEQS